MEQTTVKEQITVVDQTPVTGVPTKTKFGAFNSPTPEWANWMFRIVFLVTTVLAGYLAATNLLSIQAKYETTLVLKVLIDPLVYGLSKMFGVEVDTELVEERVEKNRIK